MHEERTSQGGRGMSKMGEILSLVRNIFSQKVKLFFVSLSFQGRICKKVKSRRGDLGNLKLKTVLRCLGRLRIRYFWKKNSEHSFCLSLSVETNLCMLNTYKIWKLIENKYTHSYLIILVLCCLYPFSIFIYLRVYLHLDRSVESTKNPPFLSFFLFLIHRSLTAKRERERIVESIKATEAETQDRIVKKREEEPTAYKTSKQEQK